jgi:hypothetical protein
MKNRRLSFHKIVALAIAGLLAAQLAAASMAANLNDQASDPTTGLATINLSSEARVLSAYTNRLVDFLKSTDELKKKPSITKTQAAAVNAEAEGLKRRVSEVIQAIRTAIRKLKEVGIWNQVDAIVYARLRDNRLRSIFERAGGPRAVLEKSVSEIQDGAAPFFRDRLSELELKIQAQGAASFINRQASASSFNLVAVRYGSARPLRKDAFACKNLLANQVLRIFGDRNVPGTLQPSTNNEANELRECDSL